MFVVQIDGPCHQTTEADRVCPFYFLIECFRIVIRDPLIVVECEIFHSCFLIVDLVNVVSALEDILDLYTVVSCISLSAQRPMEGGKEGREYQKTRECRLRLCSRLYEQHR
jgi:hypothetical protein